MQIVDLLIGTMGYNNRVFEDGYQKSEATQATRIITAAETWQECVTTEESCKPYLVLWVTKD